MNSSVKELRLSGYKVRVGHLRRFYYPALKEPISGKMAFEITCSPPIPFPRGGITVVRITTPEGMIAETKAICAETDQYNKKRGVKIALGRAFKKLELGEFSPILPSVLKLPNILDLNPVVME